MSKEREKPGPEPERLKIDEEDWGKAVKRALRKGKPEAEQEPKPDQNKTDSCEDQPSNQ